MGGRIPPFLIPFFVGVIVRKRKFTAVMSVFLVLVLSAFMTVGAPQPYLMDVSLSESNPDAKITISDDGSLHGFDGCHTITGLVSIAENTYTPTTVKVSEPIGECDQKIVSLASNITGMNVVYEVKETPAGVAISTYPGLLWNLMGDTRMEPEGAPK